MAVKPAAPCRVCRKLHCADTAHSYRPFATAEPTRVRRPGYDAERRRRRQFVKDVLNATGTYLGDGLWLANCTLCHRRLALPLAQWTADHVIPVAAGGTESGPLRLSCMRCQRAQGGREGQRRQTHG